MSYEDYQKGEQNPWGIVDISKPGWMDYQQGQFDAWNKAMHPNLPPPPPGTPTASGPMHSGPAVQPYEGPQPKGLVRSLLLSGVFGPVGLFYASKKGAMLILLALLAIPAFVNSHTMVGGSTAGSSSLLVLEIEGVRALWPISILCSLVWSIAAIRIHNNKVSRAKLEWLQNQASKSVAS